MARLVFVAIGQQELRNQIGQCPVVVFAYLIMPAAISAVFSLRLGVQFIISRRNKKASRELMTGFVLTK
jgi:hypothetical protein